MIKYRYNLDYPERGQIIKISPEEAEAFRERVRKQHEELATWVVIPVDEFLEFAEDLKRNM